MKKAKRERSEESGWKVGTAAEFLELTPEESALIEIKLALSRELRERRQKRTDAGATGRKDSIEPVTSRPRVAISPRPNIWFFEKEHTPPSLAPYPHGSREQLRCVSKLSNGNIVYRLVTCESFSAA